MRKAKASLIPPCQSRPGVFKVSQDYIVVRPCLKHLKIAMNMQKYGFLWV